jgi:adenylate cyclase
MSIPRRAVAEALKTLTQPLAALGRLPVVRQFRAAAGRLAALGTDGYPPDVQRRLKILNMIAYLIAATTAIYAVQQSLMDFATYRPVILINLFLVALALLVPLAHRYSDTAGGLLLIGAEYVALMGFSAFFGREGGAHLQYFIAAAAPFVVFGLARLGLVLSIVVLGLVLHLVAALQFPAGSALVAHDPKVVEPLYIQAAVTTAGLIAASVYYAFNLAEKAKAETDTLLRNILPDSVVERLKSKPGAAIADSFADASVLFADISGFVPLARQLGAAETVALLNRVVTEFDLLAARHGVEKIKTIGDAYMVAAGVPEPAADHVRRLALMAIDMQKAVAAIGAATGHPLAVRMGMASGPVMAGVIGSRKFSYDVWGDAVNLASRLEATGTPGRIHVCPACRHALGREFTFESRGLLDIKGLGPQETWYLLGLD